MFRVANVRLSAHGVAVPFIFASGYGAKGLDPRFAAVPVLQKPFSTQSLASNLARAREIHATL
jgi:FixJ family two-component response regulator